MLGLVYKDGVMVIADVLGARSRRFALRGGADACAPALRLVRKHGAL